MLWDFNSKKSSNDQKTTSIPLNIMQNENSQKDNYYNSLNEEEERSFLPSLSNSKDYNNGLFLTQSNNDYSNSYKNNSEDINYKYKFNNNNNNINNNINNNDEYNDNDNDPLISNQNIINSDSITNTDNKKFRFFKNLFPKKSSHLKPVFLHYRRPSTSIDRTIWPGTLARYPSNAISNAKYDAFTFLPLTLYEQFRFFFNLYFLLVALSQIVPALRIGYLSSYIVPLAFVLIVTLSKEAWDDICRRKRDSEANREIFEVLGSKGSVSSKNLTVGDLVIVRKDQRVPADLVLCKTTEHTGECFIRTDQLDGETDWKLRVVCPITQRLSDAELTAVSITVSPPTRDIHSFVGNLRYKNETAALTVDNTLWANTVLASGSIIGMVVYTGIDTRQAMNTSKAGTKTGLLELEINNLSKILCASVFISSFILVALHGFGNLWYVSVMKFLILFSSIIPVSLRVNLDLGKSVYAYQIEHDESISGTIVRTSTIPEDLGRIEYLLTDKTGTLTQNDMELKKLHVGTVSYSADALDEISMYFRNDSSSAAGGRSRRDIGHRVRDIIFCLAVCHNVTPSEDEDVITYQASSPDEIAIVRFTESVGLELHKRDRKSMTLINTFTNEPIQLDILHTFPFNSETKRMGIIVQVRGTDDIWFFEKGADAVMEPIVQQNDWLEEETGNMAREGLRTLVIARKKLPKSFYTEFDTKYKEASLNMVGREKQMATVISTYLECNLELLGLTGVEDKLQRDVKPSLELLRNAGIKIWMLTGDKVETAQCVAISSKLVAKGQFIYSITKLESNSEAKAHMKALSDQPEVALLIDGTSLHFLTDNFQTEFIPIAVKLSVVIACRCSPTQKATMAKCIKEYTNKRVCCIGDGGNDVSMIQAANVGVGIVGKEGRQASLAADFSVTQFCHITTLLIWHGRNSYKRSAKLAQFVIHRGLIISVCQAVYSICSSFEPLALYQGWLLVGYATVYTMAPVFSLVLDRDVDKHVALLYPELYKELRMGKSLSYKSFFIWFLVSTYQGIIVQGLSQILIGLSSSVFTRMVAVSFTAIILNELIMVALEIITWNKTMIITEIVTFFIYICSFPFLGDYFDLEFTKTFSFYWKTLFITATALIPPWIGKVVRRKFKPPNYAKVQSA